MITATQYSGEEFFQGSLNEFKGASPHVPPNIADYKTHGNTESASEADSSRSVVEVAILISTVCRTWRALTRVRGTGGRTRGIASAGALMDQLKDGIWKTVRRQIEVEVMAIAGRSTSPAPLPPSQPPTCPGGISDTHVILSHKS